MLFAYFLIGIGLALLMLGILLGGLSGVPAGIWTALFGGVGLTGAGLWVQQAGKEMARATRLRKAHRNVSPLAEELIPQLYGDYTPYIIEAAERLGEARDTSAVPALMAVLEQCVIAQRPGWCEVAEAVANALHNIGDARALPLLYRLDTVSGIGLIPAIRKAIASIEPHASLLRPGSPDEVLQRSLLRPATGSTEQDTALLLRSAHPTSKE